MVSKCELCGQSFSLNIQLAIHKRTKHPDVDSLRGTPVEVRSPEPPLVDERVRMDHLTFLESEEEGGLEEERDSEDMSDVESGGVKYKLRSTHQPGLALGSTFVNTELPINDGKEMDLPTVPTVVQTCKSEGPPSTFLLSIASLRQDLSGRSIKAIIERKQAEKIQEEEVQKERVKQAVAKNDFPSIPKDFLMESPYSRQKGSRKSQPVKMDAVRKSSRIQSLSNPSSGNSSPTQTLDSEFSCDTCCKVMSNQRNLILHRRSHHPGKLPSRPGQKRKLILKEKPSWLKKFPCKKCGKKFSEFKNLWKHRLNLCGLVSKYKCPQCSLEFRQVFGFYKHRTSHDRPSESSPKSVSSMDNSLLSPAGTTEDDSDEGFSTEDANNNHIQDASNFSNATRTDEDLEVESLLFKCRVPACSSGYSDIRQLGHHVKEAHRVFMCLYCESVLLTQDQLDFHVQKRHPVETGNDGKTEDSETEKPEELNHACGFCGKNFDTKVGAGSLREHILQAHSSEFPKSSRPEVQNTTTDSDRNSSKPEGTKLMKAMTCIVCNRVFKQFRAYILHRRDHKLSDSAGFLPEQTKAETSPEIQRKSFQSSSLPTPDLKSSSPGVETRPKRPCASVGSFQPVEKVARVNQFPVVETEERKCSECETVFSTERLLRLHMRDTCKKKSYTYQCKLCPQGFSREASLKHHVKSHHEEQADVDEDGTIPQSNGSMYRQLTEAEKLRQCTICAKIFATVKILNSHIATHHSTDDFLTPVPNRVSVKNNRVGPNPNAVLSGTNIKNSKDDRASFEPSRKSNLRTHSETTFVKKPQAVAVISPQHPRTQGDQLLKCNDCGDSFPSNTELVQHLLWHNETKAMKIVRGPKKIGVAQPPEPVEVLIKCVICGGGFHKKGDMLAHVKVRHSRKGKYACMECNKRFQRALDLVDHSVIHDKEFIRRQSEEAIPDEEVESEAEEEEEEGEEEDEEEEEDDDDDMEYSSSNSSNIPGRRLSSRRHVSRGPVGKIYCTKCTQSFSNNKDFRTHWQSHSVSEQERNYICTTCKEAFTQVEELNRHRQIKHPETKVFICNYPNCNIPFVHQLGLKRHQKDHHGAVK